MSAQPSVHFAEASERTAAQPAEHRGLARDGVRLLVARPGAIEHTTFAKLPGQLRAGDVLVVNNSSTRAAQVDGHLAGRGPVVVHVASRLDDGTWVVELRTAPDAGRALLDARPGDRITLAGALPLAVVEPYPRVSSSPTGRGNRLWRAAVASEVDLGRHLLRHGRPIAYGYLDGAYPLADYQTVFASRVGSAEMPSAGRPFTADLVTRLIAGGVLVVPVTLHTGVSSQEAGEAPQPEWFEVTPAAAATVNAARALGGRVVAVGTTVTRALESAAAEGSLVAASGWTEHVVTPDHPPLIVDGLVTGWHDPQASHLLLVEAVAGTALAQRAYDAAVAGGYLWHEFGDVALLLP